MAAGEVTDLTFACQMTRGFYESVFSSNIEFPSISTGRT
jgi:hypothetical protein